MEGGKPEKLIAVRWSDGQRWGGELQQLGRVNNIWQHRSLRKAAATPSGFKNMPANSSCYARAGGSTSAVTSQPRTRLRLRRPWPALCRFGLAQQRVKHDCGEGGVKGCQHLVACLCTGASRKGRERGIGAGEQLVQRTVNRLGSGVKRRTIAESMHPPSKWNTRSRRMLHSTHSTHPSTNPAQQQAGALKHTLKVEHPVSQHGAAAHCQLQMGHVGRHEPRLCQHDQLVCFADPADASLVPSPPLPAECRAAQTQHGS